MRLIGTILLLTLGSKLVEAELRVAACGVVVEGHELTTGGARGAASRIGWVG
jgi:hypothetical protein